MFYVGFFFGVLFSGIIVVFTILFLGLYREIYGEKKNINPLTKLKNTTIRFTGHGNRKKPLVQDDEKAFNLEQKEPRVLE